MKLRLQLRRALAFTGLMLVLVAPARGEDCTLPDREWAMIRQIAANYELSEDETWLLAAIRRHENGRPGLEFGVGGRVFNTHVAHRYQDGFKSFYVQGSWAAGTIRRHYRGDIGAFGRRYCPEGPRVWAAGVSALVNRLKAENDGRLPGEAYPKRNVPFLRKGSECAHE